MRLTPSEQLAARVAALRCLIEHQNIRAYEPCDCGEHIRHNNGGNYHAILAFRVDAGGVYRAESYTGDFGPAFDWQEVPGGQAVDEILARADDGWTICAPQ